MKNKENKVIKEKSKSDKKQVVSKIFAFIMLLLMIFASCSTCIYYVVATIQKLLCLYISNTFKKG